MLAICCRRSVVPLPTDRHMNCEQRGSLNERGTHCVWNGCVHAVHKVGSQSRPDKKLAVLYSGKRGVWKSSLTGTVSKPLVSSNSASACIAGSQLSPRQTVAPQTTPLSCHHRSVWHDHVTSAVLACSRAATKTSWWDAHKHEHPKLDHCWKW